MRNVRRALRWIGRVLLIAAYVLVMVFGLLSGMLGETLIGAEDPWAGVLADSILWFSVVVGLSPLLPLTSMLFAPQQKRTLWWWIVRALPFALLAIQLGLAAVAEKV